MWMHLFLVSLKEQLSNTTGIIQLTYVKRNETENQVQNPVSVQTTSISKGMRTLTCVILRCTGLLYVSGTTAVKAMTLSLIIILSPLVCLGLQAHVRFSIYMDVIYNYKRNLHGITLTLN